MEETVRILKKCQEVAKRALYYIYCRRNKIWPDPELISYTWKCFDIKIYLFFSYCLVSSKRSQFDLVNF